VLLTAAAAPLDWRCAEAPFAIDRGGSREFQSGPIARKTRQGRGNSDFWLGQE
jgi:hypothetical protein